MRTTSSKAARVVLVSLLVLIFFTLFGIIQVSKKAEAQINEKKQKEEAFNEWLDRLILFECPNCQRDSNFQRLDSNGEYSYSCLQFQRKTFEEMARRFKIRTEPLGTKGGDIYNCEIQRQVATAMFLDNPKKASYHWYTSIYKKGLGLPPSLE